jgi:hypothetical protein
VEVAHAWRLDARQDDRLLGSERCVAVFVEPGWVFPGEGDCFQHRMDAKLAHQIAHVGADGMHREMELLRHSVTMRSTLR